MIIEKVRAEIARHDKPQNKLNYQRFYKEKLKIKDMMEALLRNCSA